MFTPISKPDKHVELLENYFKDVCASRFLLSAQLKERLRVLVQVTCPFTL